MSYCSSQINGMPYFPGVAIGRFNKGNHAAILLNKLFDFTASAVDR